MKHWKKILALAVILAAGAVIGYFAVGSDRLANMQKIPDNALVSGPSLNLWYTDEALSDYLASAALAFSEQENVRVIPRLVSGLDYLEQINQESLATNMFPDLYIIGNESLEKAWLAGLACEVRDEGFVSEDNFPGQAVRAVTYQGKTAAYPFSFETSALLYNQTYMEELARAALQAEADAREGEAAMRELEENGEPAAADAVAVDAAADAGTDGSTAEEIAAAEGTATAEETAAAEDAAATDAAAQEDAQAAERAREMIPRTIENILSFADSYDAPEQVEAVFKWDVSDIFYNYFFVGNYINVGGADGDDTEQIDIYNMDAIRCLSAYQELNQFFSIDPDEVNYDSVQQEFLEGKLVFTVATSDAVSRLEAAKADGTFPYEYGVTTIPDINDELQTRSLSVTNALVVNGYSQKKDMANAFARYLVEEASAGLYENTGKLPAYSHVEYTVPQAAAFAQEYGNSVPIPKMMAASNYWVQMEIAFTKIWSGAEVSQTLKELSEQIRTQVKGEPVTEEYIEPPQKETQVSETD